MTKAFNVQFLLLYLWLYKKFQNKNGFSDVLNKIKLVLKKKHRIIFKCNTIRMLHLGYFKRKY